MMAVLARSVLRAVGALSIVVLAAPGCSFLFKSVPPSPPPTANEAFEGCFTGAINRGANIGEMTLVIVKTPETEFGLDACLSFVLSPTVDVVSMTGNVDADNPNRADITGSLSGGGFLTLELTLSPAGEVLSIEVPNGAFDADPQVRCDPEITFGELCPAALFSPSTLVDAP
jgi:hypothetical protein